MASKELIAKVTEYDAVTSQAKKIDKAFADAYKYVARVAIETEGDIEYGLELTKKAKHFLNEYLKQERGYDVWYLEKYGQEHDKTFDIVEEYYEILLLEAPHLFISNLYYMEKDRPISKRFYQPREKTLEVVANDLQDLEDGVITFYGLSEPPRVGKLIADDVPVMTENGWKNHGDLTIGDKVVGLNGEWVKVVYVHPKNVANKRVWFSDHTFIDCHENHEWIVYDRSKKDLRIVETKQLANSEYICGNKRRYRFQLPITLPMQGTYKELVVNPYILGAWLGDGTTKKPVVTICNTDKVILEEIEKEYVCTTYYEQVGCNAYSFEGLRQDLNKIGLCYFDKKVQKHIPKEYMFSSFEQRLDLLAGIIDTDGTLRKTENRYSISTIEEQFKDDIVSLISSFGWRVCVCKYPPKKSSSGIEGKHDVYTISFNPTFEIPCRVERKQLKEFSKQRKIGFVGIEDIEPKSGNCITVEGGIYRVGKTLKPTHNSTICIFFLAWHMGRNPHLHNAMGGHSGLLAKGFYKEALNLITSADYKFSEIFPNVELVDKSAEDFTIFFKKDRFASLTCRGIDGTWTGAVDVSNNGILYVDDLIRDRQESLSPIRLEGRYQDYLNVMVDRKNDGAKELMVATRWNLFDPLGRCEVTYKDNPLARFRKIPALNENDESNFDYDCGVGFSTEYYKELRDRLDPNEWMAKYQQQPFLREGLLFPSDELNYFNGTLPEGARSVLSAIDVSFGGGDNLSMPIGVCIGEDVYIVDWVFTKEDKFITRPMVVGATMRNGVQRLQIEGNAGGREYAEVVENMLKEQKYPISITTPRADNTKSKNDRIIQYSADIKRNFYFLEPKLQSKEYRNAMEELNMFVVDGKNLHDDSADSLTQLCDMWLKGTRVAKIEAIANPFWGSRY